MPFSAATTRWGNAPPMDLRGQLKYCRPAAHAMQRGRHRKRGGHLSARCGRMTASGATAKGTPARRCNHYRRTRSSAALNSNARSAPPRGITKVVCATESQKLLSLSQMSRSLSTVGCARKVSCDTRTGAPYLRTERISIAAARQRAGRAGRVRSGSCLPMCAASRLWVMRLTGVAPSRRLIPHPKWPWCRSSRSAARAR